MSASGPLDTDTIVAIATAPGRGGIGIVRLSGPDAAHIGAAITGAPLTPRYAHYRPFRHTDDAVVDSGIALFFPGPGSFTGEDVVELQGHGGPLVLALVEGCATARGARQARPGEFTERAFLNAKLDLAQAEAVADLIDAQTQTAARQAQASLQGRFSDAVSDVAGLLLELRKFVESAIDFPEEEIDFLGEGRVLEQLRALIAATRSLAEEAQRGAIVRNGASVVLAGLPNAGKSSLLNRLAGDQVAIVTDIPGTTRDLVREHVEIAGIPLRITDTAGLRDSDDAIEAEGVRRAHREIELADLTLQIIDDSTTGSLDLPASGQQVIRVYNKVDVSGRPPGHFRDGDVAAVAISTLTGAGIPELEQAVASALGIGERGDTRFSARARHVTALKETLATLTAAETHFAASAAGELLAEDLRRAHDQLGSITGRISSDDLLGEIFASFCIGK